MPSLRYYFPGTKRALIVHHAGQFLSVIRRNCLFDRRPPLRSDECAAVVAIIVVRPDFDAAAGTDLFIGYGIRHQKQVGDTAAGIEHGRPSWSNPREDLLLVTEVACGWRQNTLVSYIDLFPIGDGSTHIVLADKIDG